MNWIHVMQGVSTILLLIECDRIRKNKPYSPGRLLYVMILVAAVLFGKHFW